MSSGTNYSGRQRRGQIGSSFQIQFSYLPWRAERGRLAIRRPPDLYSHRKPLDFLPGLCCKSSAKQNFLSFKQQASQHKNVVILRNFPWQAFSSDPAERRALVPNPWSPAAGITKNIFLGVLGYTQRGLGDPFFSFPSKELRAKL